MLKKYNNICETIKTKPLKGIFFFILLFFFFIQNTVAQTLSKGDIVVVGVNYNFNTNSGDPDKTTACAINSSANIVSDVIYLMPLVDISQGTSFVITDNGFERRNAGKFGTTEGVIKFTLKNGNSFSKGQVIELRIPVNSNNASYLSSANPKWNTSIMQSGMSVNFAKQDQLIITSSNSSWNGTSQHNGSLTGNYLYAFNAIHDWVKLPTPSSTETQNSALPGYDNASTDYTNIDQNDLRRHHFTPNKIETNPKEFSFSYYNGPRTATSKNEWLIRLLNPNNWKNESTCSNFQNNINTNSISIIDKLDEFEKCADETIPLSVELDNTSNSIQINYEWFRVVTPTNTGGTSIGVGRELSNYKETTAGTYYYYCKITYQLKWNNCQTNNNTSNCSEARSTNIVNSGYIKVKVTPLPKIAPIEMN
ncbi:hypothetical protein [Empedobacter brevis]|uniref:hypothetical protein n=1 Tax=Empedobacter brevis TaxID=247 RepID=UPI00334147E6